MFDGGWLLHDREIDGMLSGTVEAVLHAARHSVATQTRRHSSGGNGNSPAGDGPDWRGHEQAATACSRIPPPARTQQAAGYDLQDHMSDLHQIVVRFEQFRTRAVRVFEIQAAVLLTIETLVLHMPAMSASFRGEFDHRVFTYVQIGDPSKGGGLFVDGFLTDDAVKRWRLGPRCPHRSNHVPSDRPDARPPWADAPGDSAGTTRARFGTPATARADGPL